MSNLTTHNKSFKYVLAAFCLTVFLMIIQMVAAYFSNSLALFADGTHLLVHNSSLLVALISSALSLKYAQKNYEKAQVVDIIGGIINCSIFLSIAFIIFFKGFERTNHSHSSLNINPIIMAISSLFAFIIHCIAAFILSKGRKHSFNVHAIFLHTFIDCLSTILTFTASLVILFTNFYQADAIVSMVIAILVAFSGLRLLKKCIEKALNIHKSHKLIKKIHKVLLSNVKHISNIHAQEIIFNDKNQISYSAHIVLCSNKCIKNKHNEDCLIEINNILMQKFGINDTIIQLEYN